MIDFFQFLIYLSTIGVFLYLLERQQRRFDKKHEQCAEERKELLDRIMANNIHEYKAASGAQAAKRSENGNFLVDRMERTYKKQYIDFE